MKLFLIAASLLFVSFNPIQRSTVADIVFKNGNVYTANDKTPKAQAIAVKADKIVFVGTNAAAQKFVGPNTRVVDLKGNTVLPGFTDAPQHLSGVGQREMTLNLEGTTSLEDLLAKVKARVRMQSCDNEVCFPPKNYDVSLKIDVVGANDSVKRINGWAFR